MQRDSKKGFEGLSNLETGIDDILKEEKKEKNISKKTSSHKKNNTNSKKEHHTDTSDLEKSPNEKSTESRLNAFFAFVILAIIFIIIINLATNDTSSSKTNYSQVAKTEKSIAVEKDKQSNSKPIKVESTKEPSYKNNFTIPSTNSKPKQFTCEEQQPSSYSTILNIKEVCFCLAEKIRIDAASKVVDRYSQTSINTYNQMVDNYNSRCNYKQYYKNDWNKANNYIQKNRLAYELVGELKMPKQQSSNYSNSYNNPSYSSTYNNTTYKATSSKYSLTIKPTPSDARVQIMNIKPKYYDGIKLKKGKYDIRVSKKGYQTVRTWINLQKDEYFTVTLKKKQSSYSNTSSIPANASLNYLGNGWDCNRGYYRSGNSCIAVGR